MTRSPLFIGIISTRLTIQASVILPDNRTQHMMANREIEECDYEKNEEKFDHLSDDDR